MTKIDGDCRIRDIVRNLKIRKDFSSKLHQGSDLFLQGSNQASTELRHPRKFDVHHVGRDFPRFTVDEINRRFNHQSCSTKDSNKHWVRSKVPILTVYARKKHLLQWIDAVDSLFEETQPPEKLKCKLAYYGMEGEAAQWWRKLQQQRVVRGESKISLWPRMKLLITNDFWPSMCSTKCPLWVCNDRLGEKCPFDDPTEFNISAKTIHTSTGIHRKQVMREDFKPTTCLIEGPNENTVDDNEIVNGQQAGEVLQGDNYILEAENYEEENIDLDLEESSAEEQFELKPAACLSKGQWEPHISKEEKENDSEVLGTSIDTSTNISVDILDGSLDVEHQDSVNGVPKSLMRVSQPDAYIKAFIKETKITHVVMHQTKPSTRDGQEKLELMSLAELCNMEMLGKVLTRKFDPGGIGQDRLLGFPCHDLLDGKHTMCYMSSVELESRPYVINAQSKVVENKFRVLRNYELRNLSMPLLYGKFSKGSYEKSLYAISKMDVVRSCHGYVDLWYSSFLFLFDPGGEFRPARTRSINLMTEVMLNLPPSLIMCPRNVRYIVIAFVITTLNAVWEMVERAKEHQVIGNIQGSKIPNTVDKCIEERLEHLLVDAHDPQNASSIISFDDIVGEALKLLGCTLSELFHVIRRRDWKTYCHCLVDFPINLNLLEKVCKLVAFNLLSFEIVHDLKECGNRERDSSAYIPYVTNFVMSCGMIMGSFDPSGKRHIVPKTSDKRGLCLVANQEVHSPVVILWVGIKYRNAGYSLGSKGDKYVHRVVKLVWTRYRDGWYTIQGWKIPRGLVEDLHWHTEKENALFIFDPGGLQRLTATGKFGRCDGLGCYRMVNLLNSRAKISARILFVYSFRYSIDMRATLLYCSLWSTYIMRVWSAKIMAMISWRHMNEFSPYRKKLNMLALMEFSTTRSSEFHSIVVCAPYRLHMCMLVIMAPLQSGFFVVGGKDGLDLLAMHDSAIQHVHFGLFVHVSSVIQTSLLQVVQYYNIATECFLALLMHPVHTASKQSIPQGVSNRKMISASHFQAIPIIAFHASNWAYFTAGLATTMHDNLTRGRVIHLEGWKGENNADMENKLTMGECIIDSCVINFCKNRQTREHLKLFYKVVNGLDPPKRYIW